MALGINDMNSIEFFGLKRKLRFVSSVESFFEFHSSAMRRKKDKKRTHKENFLANSKSLNEFKALNLLKFY